MRIAFLDTVHPLLIERMEARGWTCLERTTQSRAKLEEESATWDGIVIRSRIPMQAAFLDTCTQLKFLARSGAGLENIDLTYCKSRGIVVHSAAEGNRDAVGEHALGMLLTLWNRLREGDAEMRQGIWRREANRGRELSGKTVGILGYGRMGSAFAQKLVGLGVRIVAHDKFKLGFAEGKVEEVDLDTLQREADILSVHIDQRPGNDHFVNAAFLNGFAKPLTVINTGRGKTLDTAGLVSAMKSGKVEGACLDVYEYEKRSFEQLNTADLPEAFQYLLQSPRTLLSPHVAGWTTESYLKLSAVLADKIEAQFPA